MPTIYGTSTIFEDVRTVIDGKVGALMTAMTAGGISPKIDYKYTTHWGTPGLSFPCVTIGIENAELTFPAMKSSPAGPIIDFACTVELRVLIGNDIDYMDEIKTAQLCQSIINWFQTYRSLGSQFFVWGTARVELNRKFEDVCAIGGIVTLVVRKLEAYTAA